MYGTLLRDLEGYDRDQLCAIIHRLDVAIDLCIEAAYDQGLEDALKHTGRPTFLDEILDLTPQH